MIGFCKTDQGRILSRDAVFFYNIVAEIQERRSAAAR
jgi:hypothetical protein